MVLSKFSPVVGLGMTCHLSAIVNRGDVVQGGQCDQRFRDHPCSEAVHKTAFQGVEKRGQN